jgi:hypothetical protein
MGAKLPQRCAQQTTNHDSNLAIAEALVALCLLRLVYSIGARQRRCASLTSGATKPAGNSIVAARAWCAIAGNDASLSLRHNILDVNA